MILDKIKIYSQKIHKNNFLINIILKIHSLFDIIFIQELSWSIIWSILSSSNCEKEELVEVSNYLNWTMFSKNFSLADNFSRVISYINIHLSFMCFFFWNNVLNHKDILYIYFFNHNSTFFFINIYSDSSLLALNYLKDTEVNINNVLVMTGNFNIRDCLWDSSYPLHFSYKDTLFKIADSFHVELSKPTEILSTRYSDNTQDSNLVLDLVFLHPNSMEHNNHHIHSEWRLTSNHASITIDIHIYEEQVQTRKQSLSKNSKDKACFIKELIYSIKRLSTDPIPSIDAL